VEKSKENIFWGRAGARAVSNMTLHKKPWGSIPFVSGGMAGDVGFSRDDCVFCVFIDVLCMYRFPFPFSLFSQSKFGSKFKLASSPFRSKISNFQTHVILHKIGIF
jgi:hypothetical protein